MTRAWPSRHTGVFIWLVSQSSRLPSTHFSKPSLLFIPCCQECNTLAISNSSDSPSKNLSKLSTWDTQEQAPPRLWDLPSLPPYPCIAMPANKSQPLPGIILLEHLSGSFPSVSSSQSVIILCLFTCLMPI